MALLTPPTEETPYYVGGHAIGGAEPDGHWNIPDPGVLERADAGIGRPFDWEFLSLPELCAARPPGLVLFGNSFSDLYWELGLQRYFCFIRRARDPASRFKLFYDTMPPGPNILSSNITSRGWRTRRSCSSNCFRRTRSDGRIARHGIQLGAVPLRLHADILLAVLSDRRPAQELADPDCQPDLLRRRRRQHGAGAAGLDRRQSVFGAAHRARAAVSP